MIQEHKLQKIAEKAAQGICEWMTKDIKATFPNCSLYDTDCLKKECIWNITRALEDQANAELVDLRLQLEEAKEKLEFHQRVIEQRTKAIATQAAKLEAAKEERRRLRGIITDWQKQWSEFGPKLQQAEAELAELRHKAGIH